MLKGCFLPRGNSENSYGKVMELTTFGRSNATMSVTIRHNDFAPVPTLAPNACVPTTCFVVCLGELLKTDLDPPPLPNVPQAKFRSSSQA